MLHISLFSGVGGFDLASEWMGWKNIASCEINEFGNKILEYYWPEAYHHRDIHTFTYDTIDHELSKRFGSHWRSEDIILTGGFPCQPYSTAGKRLGKADSRHLWPEMLRTIREIQPRWIVGENVRGLISWNGGMVFDEVQSELEAEGYSVLPFVLPAVSVNAPHRRDRVWFVARYAESNGDTQKREVFGERQRGEKSTDTFGTCADATQNTIRDGCLRGEPIEEGAEVRQQRDISTGDTERVCGEEMAGLTANANNPRTDIEMPSEREWQKNDVYGGFSQPEFGSIGGNGDVTHTNNIGFRGESDGIGDARFFGQNDKASNWENFPTQSPVCHGNDGIPDRLDGITFSKWRQESIKAGGNAVVPQVVLQIFKAIEQYNNL